MTRRLSKSASSPTNDVLPIANGGTGSSSIANAVDNLGIVTASQRNKSLGPVTLNSSKKLNTSLLPAGNVGSVNITGSLTAYAGKDQVYRITDYDLLKLYTVSVTSGSVKRTGANITFSPPESTGIVTLTINEKIYSINVI